MFLFPGYIMVGSKRFCLNAVCITLLLSVVTARNLHDVFDPYDQEPSAIEDSDFTVDGKQTWKTV